MAAEVPLPGQAVPLPQTDQAAGLPLAAPQQASMFPSLAGRPAAAAAAEGQPAPVNLEGAPPGVTPETIEMYAEDEPPDFTDAIANATLEDMDALEWAFKLRPPGG